jgi:replicative DNA helicase
MRSRRPSSSEEEPSLPPHSLEAERGVIGCLLVEAERCAAESTQAGEVMEECVRIGMDPTWFYDLRHRELWTAARDMADQGKPFDLILVTARFQASGQLEAVGGVGYLMEMAQSVPSAANLSHYLNELRDKHALRHVLKVCAETAIAVREGPKDVTAFVADFESRTLGLSESHVPTSFRPISDDVPAFIDTLETRHRGKQNITGIETPYWYLNNMTCGLQPREMTLIAARPSCGKTALLVEKRSPVPSSSMVKVPVANRLALLL